jgi:hypothetical protein
VGDIDDSTGFHYQHDIRRLDNGNYMLYDNGNFHSPPYSRAVEYALDTGGMTATRVWQYRDTPDTYGDFMGSAQRLPGGNTVIAWGGNHAGPITTITEVHPDGSKAFELSILNGTLNYKGYRFPWSGTAPRPELWVCEFDKWTQRLTLNFDKFGDAGVALYELYMGVGGAPLALADSTTANTIDVPDIETGETYHFRVRSIDGATAAGAYSNEVTFVHENSEPTHVSLIGPADGTVVDAAAVELSWTRAIDAEGDDVTYSVHIFEAGAEAAIDGIADTCYVYGGSSQGPRAEFAWTVSAKDHEFSAASPDTFTVRSSRAGFGVPTAPGLHQNFPNPFNPGTTIRYDLRNRGHVTLTIYNILGQEIRTLIDEVRPEGFWSIEWDGRDNRGAAVASGVYLCKLETPGHSSSRKMTLVR